MDDLNGTAAEERAWAAMQAAIERCREHPTPANRQALATARRRLNDAMNATLTLPAARATAA